MSKVLVVDDQQMIRETMESVLASINVETVHASSGMEALEAIEENEVAVILMDVKMPGIDGYETARRILAQEQHKHVPIIMFSGEPSDDQYLKAFNAGAVDFVPKPIKRIVLVNKIQQFMALNRLREYAEAENQTKSLFLSTVSHELRTPLNAMIGYTTKLLTRLDGLIPDRDLVALGHVHENAHHQLRLVNDLLDVSALEAGKLAISRNTVIVADIVEAALQQVAGLAAEKGLLIMWQRCDDNLTIFADAQRLVQILINLLSNAIKYTPQGEVEICVKDECESISISVRDTGVGIKETQDLFKLFSRLQDVHELCQEGIGLGLYISSQLTTMQGGTIEVKSTPGKGSLFTIKFPKTAAE